MPTPVLLADTELLFAAGFAAVLANRPAFALEPVARDQVSLGAALDRLSGTVCVVSTTVVADPPAIERTARQRGHRLVLLSTHETDSATFQASALHGVLRRDVAPEVLLDCLTHVSEGKVWTGSSHRLGLPPTSSAASILSELTPRQVCAMGLVTQGVKNSEIAQRLGTSEQVIKNLLRAIYDRTGVSDRLELALYVLHHPELARAASVAASQPVLPRAARG